jgi:cell division protein FtsZ
MMGTGEAGGDNRAIEAAERAIANPLLDGVSMKGAKGVIVSITGGEDMRLMEVDEAANHIKELVDPDANIIWGSAFNNDLEGKIRVSVVATGIEADVSPQAEPAKVFSFPAARKVEDRPAPVVTPAPAPAPVPEARAADPAPAAVVAPSAAATMAATTPVAAAEGDELLLGAELTPPVGRNPLPTPAKSETVDAGRPWMSAAAEEPRPVRQPAPAPARAREGGTLFERMSNIARGAAKAQVEEEPEAPRGRDPLDIPRFLNRQNNQ